MRILSEISVRNDCRAAADREFVSVRFCFRCYQQAGLTGEAADAMEGTSNSPACFRTYQNRSQQAIIQGDILESAHDSREDCPAACPRGQLVTGYA